jgi:flavin-dependent dehydrogenase
MKIVIVGGGTAGWLSALFLANKNLRNDKYEPYDITVIESSKIGIIGAGEGTTGIMVDTILNKLKNIKGLSEREFFKRSSATIKLGLNCIDWDGVGTRYYEPLQTTKTANNIIDIHYLMGVKYGSALDSVQNALLWQENKVPFINKTYNSIGGYAYHFDAHKVADYLKEVALLNGVKHIDGEVEELDIDKKYGFLRNVTVVNTGQIIDADFWIDASGFKRMLINPMGGGWVDYRKWLPCNSAIPYIHQFEEGEVIQPSTMAWAQKNGWMWQIPTQERYGCGYVYDDRFVSDEEALKELEETTGRKITPIKTIKFDSGRLENAWVNNVLAVGLSSNFLEPLEATSIHSTIAMLDMFCNFHLSPMPNVTVQQTSINKFNKYFAYMIDEFRDLVQMHYMTKREDTPFWKFVKNEMEKTDKVKEIMDICQYRSPNYMDWSNYHGTAGWGVWCWILSGLGYVTPLLAHQTLFDHDFVFDDKNMYDRMKSTFMQQSKDFSTHEDFLNYIKS